MIYIKAWGHDIGQLVEYKGIIKFKYLPTNILDFSPIKMPVKSPKVYEFSHLKYQHGLPVSDEVQFLAYMILLKT